MNRKIATIATTSTLLLFFQGQSRLAYASQIGLAVYPPTITLMTQAPINLKIPIQVKNTSDTELSVSTDLIPFLSTQYGGSLPLYNLDKKTSDSLKQNITSLVSVRDGQVPVANFTLEPQEVRKLSLEVSIPKLYKSTDYYFSIRYTAQANTTSSQPSDDSVQATQNISVTSNVLVGIGDQEDPRISVTSFFPGSYIITSSSVPFLVAVKNNGSHFTKVSGDIRITNMLTGIKTLIPLATGNVLKGSERYLTAKSIPLDINSSSRYQSDINPLLRSYIISYSSPLLLGVYKADLELATDSDSTQTMESLYFLALPLKGIIILMLICIIIFLVKKRARKIRNKIEN